MSTEFHSQPERKRIESIVACIEDPGLLIISVKLVFFALLERAREGLTPLFCFAIAQVPNAAGSSAYSLLRHSSVLTAYRIFCGEFAVSG